jgi:hypothetical protein
MDSNQEETLLWNFIKSVPGGEIKERIEIDHGENGECVVGKRERIERQRIIQ